ncbi:MAG: signal peptidase II [Candidatus Omnitrophica bacterium]|nr:signal peptidase II [Candidatus Omnitrophota bacterium]MDD5672465.1 signal peptidase II [Candidatus Omnitrophota bacterium]
MRENLQTHFQKAADGNALCALVDRGSIGRGERQTSFLIPFYSLVFLVVGLDQLTKYFVLVYLPAGDSVPVIRNLFHLTLVYNQGIAFGFFQRHPTVLFVLITSSLLVLAVLGVRACRSTKSADGKLCPQMPGLARWGLALILGGAIGNWIDRIRFEAVVDFLDFRVWPVFNVADSSITIGVCLYLLLLMRKS